jgi:hypothetical protein
MHDLDRTSFEMGDEASQYGEYEFEGELPGGTYDRPFSEAELDELALELLQVRDEQELDQFLGSLLSKAASAIGKFVRSPAGNALKGILKTAISSAVPVLGGVVSSLIPDGGTGAEVGAAIQSELEYEGVPAENRDVEAAKKVIEVGGAAAQQVAAMPPNAPPQAAVDAVQSAAQQQGVASAPPAPPSGGSPDSGATSGQWYRRGRTIVIVGL